MAEYFEHLQAFIERKVLDTVLEIVEHGDSILQLETLKLLSSLLCHNKVALDFVNQVTKFVKQTILNEKIESKDNIKISKKSLSKYYLV